MKKIARMVLLALMLLLLPACSKPGAAEPPSPAPPDGASAETDAPPPQKSEVELLMETMTIREQVEQMFILSLQECGTDTEAAGALLDGKQPGGYVLFAENIATTAETKAFVDAVAERAAIAPFVAIDEEGGVVSRLHSGGLTDYINQPKAYDIGVGGDTEAAYEAGARIGSALKALGFNLDFAPDADVLTNPENTVIGSRSFGADAALVSDMAAAFQRGLHDEGILSAPKHFPGHGGTSGDSHEGFVSIDYDAAHLASVEYVPFARTIAEGAEFILVGHITAPNADASGLPASLSPYFVTEVLRGELGFSGVIVTDAMNMGAIADHYAPAESAVKAIEAGIDVILMPENYEEAVQGVLDAVERGEISAARIQESVARILSVKISAGILS